MEMIEAIEGLSALRGPVCLAIGVFDGVHLGHQAVIRRVLDDAAALGGSAVVVTFDPHPMRVVRPERAPRLLTNTLHKKVLLEALGVRHLLVIPFNEAFAATPPHEFVLALHAACRPLHEICVGHTWSFGKGRAGNLELLRTMGDQLGFDEIGIPAVEIDGEIISSTLIRAAVESGNLDRAARLLGRRFSILGEVVQGAKLGRKLGFPTANLRAYNEQFPPNGVYAVQARFGGEEALRAAVVNIGVRPTVRAAGGERLLEVHLLDFEGDLYGRSIEVFFRDFLRGEEKFADLEALQTQIGRDVAAARQRLAGC